VSFCRRQMGLGGSMLLRVLLRSKKGLVLN
jgi:hypothetical protein